MATLATAPQPHVEKATQQAVFDKATLPVTKEPGPIMNPVLGFVFFFGAIIASNLVLDGLNYLINHLLGR